MTIIERHYFSGLVEVQVDHTRTSSGQNELDSCDVYETAFGTIEEVDRFIKDIGDHVERLPDVLC